MDFGKNELSLPRTITIARGFFALWGRNLKVFQSFCKLFKSFENQS